VDFQTTDAPRILIVRLSAMGDVIHTLPCLDVLRRRFPRAHIAWVAEELSRDLLEGHPQLDEVFIIPKKRWRGHTLKYLFPEIVPFYRVIRSRRFDVAIDFQGLTKSGLAARLSGAPLRIGFGGVDCREINGWFTNRKVTPPPDAHIIDRNLSLLSALGIEDFAYERVLPQREEWRSHIAQWFEKEGIAPGTRFVALNPGAGWVTKQWRLDRFAKVGVRLVTELKRNVLITWGPGEEEMAQTIQGLMQEQGASSRLAPRTTIGQSIELMRHIDLFIGGDTGPTHLAAAAGVPVVAIYGASDSARNHPAATRQIILQKPHACGPCWKKTPPQDCVLRCLESITSSEVFEAAARLLDRDER
jgi:heptosyltransferase I